MRSGQKWAGHGTRLLKLSVFTTCWMGTKPSPYVMTSSPSRSVPAKRQPFVVSTVLLDRNPPAGQTAQPRGLPPASQRCLLDSENWRVMFIGPFVTMYRHRAARRGADGACPRPVQERLTNRSRKPGMQRLQGFFASRHRQVCACGADGGSCHGRPGQQVTRANPLPPPWPYLRQRFRPRDVSSTGGPFPSSAPCSCPPD